MYELTIFSYLLYIFALGYAVERLFKNPMPWDQLVKLICWAGGAVVVFLLSHSLVIGFLNNYLWRSFSNYGNTGLVGYLFCIGGAYLLAWLGITRWLLAPKTASGKLLLITIMVLLFLNTSFETLKELAKEVKDIDISTLMLPIMGLACVIMVTTFLFHKEKVQNYVAVPIGALIVILISSYAYYCTFAINPLENATSWIHGMGGMFIVFGVSILYATVWHQDKKWNERLSYKILSKISIALLVYGVALTGLTMLGASHKLLFRAKQNANIAKKMDLERKLTTTSAAIIDGLTEEDAMRIIKDPNSSQADFDRARKSIDKRDEMSVFAVEKQEEIESTYALGRAGNFVNNKIIKPAKSTYNASKAIINEHFPPAPTPKSATTKTGHSYGRGTYELTVGPEWTEWISLAPGHLNYDINPENEVHVKFDEGIYTVRSDIDTALPNKERIRFELRAEPTQKVTLTVW